MSSGDIYRAITSDFESSWNALSLIPERVAPGRGNFMFARQGVTLLEWAARLASSGRGRTWTRAIANELYQIEPKYFAVLPGPCGDNSDFRLPSVGPNPCNQLLWAVFDLIRNGGAHQYQQITVLLPNRREFSVSVTGVAFGEMLGRVRRHDYHLWFQSDRRGNVWLSWCPDTFFLDLMEAVQRSGLLGARLRFRYLRRVQPRPASTGAIPRLRSFRLLTRGTAMWNFDTHALKRSFLASGLHEV